jgi:hypothetical protein
MKQGFKRAPDDVLKGRKIYKINRTAFQPKTPAAASVTGTSVAATTNGTTALQQHHLLLLIVRMMVQLLKLTLTMI